MPSHSGPFPITRALLSASAAARSAAPDVEPPTPPPVGAWAPDLLGPGHQATTLSLEPDEEGDVVATLVRYRPGLGGRRMPVPRFAVLYLHGWNDYVLNPELGPFWARNGGAFYGLDLRKYGRSLRPGQTPGFIDDLGTYDEDIAAALAVIAGERPGLPLVLMGHSTGGLTGSLWADRHPEQVAGLVLVSPWLELQGSSLARILSMPIISEIARSFPKRRVPLNPDLGYYYRTIDAHSEGEWELVPAWRAAGTFHPTYAWAAAILRGHTAVSAGLDITCPVLVLRSARTLISPLWDEAMRASDVVIDVDVIAQRALRIGREITVSTIDGALHDVLLSARPVREEAYRRIERWGHGYLP